MKNKARTPRADKGQEKPKIGRPSLRSVELDEEVCAHIALGRSLRSFCAIEGNPGMRFFMRWLNEDSEFRAHYARARTAMADTLADDILQISDDGRNDTQTGEDGETIVDTDHIQRSRLRVDARRWLASKMAPEKYGEKLDLQHSGEIRVPMLREEFLKRTKKTELLPSAPLAIEEK